MTMEPNTHHVPHASFVLFGKDTFIRYAYNPIAMRPHFAFVDVVKLALQQVQDGELIVARLPNGHPLRAFGLARWTVGTVEVLITKPKRVGADLPLLQAHTTLVNTF